MGSPTKLTNTRRVMKKAARAKWRKNAERNHGTTAPNLQLNKPNANEQKQAKAKAK